MKKIILGVAALAMLASCSKDGGSDPYSSATIHLDPNTIRPYKSGIATLLTMQNDPAGFRTWASWMPSSPQWYSDLFNLSHVYNDGAWNFDPAKQWPDDGSYPLTFYALYASSLANINYTAEVGPPIALDLGITVPTSVADQVDILTGQQVTASKPASGNLGIVFNHILSKINFALDMNSGLNAYVQGLQLNRIGNSGTYDMLSIPSEWSATPMTFATNYTYYGTILPTATGGVTVLPAPALAGSPTAMTPFYTASTTPAAADANLMLVPQNEISRTWGGSVAPTALPTAAESYITMVYRLTGSSGDLAGLSMAQFHPDFATSDLADGGYSGTAPLFIKVGYPFVLAWEPGKGYVYNINLDDTTGNATGGYLLDEFYYDNKGNRTDLRVDAQTPGVNVPDPILGDGDIHLIPNPSDWDDDATGIL